MNVLLCATHETNVPVIKSVEKTHTKVPFSTFYLPSLLCQKVSVVFIYSSFEEKNMLETYPLNGLLSHECSLNSNT